MDDTEWAVYCHFWEHMIGSVPVPDAIIYLRTPADECFQRLQVRGRSEEHGISLAYLQQLEACHDEWLLGSVIPKPPVIVLDGLQSWTDQDLLERLAQILPG